MEGICIQGPRGNAIKKIYGCKLSVYDYKDIEFFCKVITLLFVQDLDYILRRCSFVHIINVKSLHCNTAMGLMLSYTQLYMYMYKALCFLFSKYMHVFSDKI